MYIGFHIAVYNDIGRETRVSVFSWVNRLKP